MGWYYLSRRSNWKKGEKPSESDLNNVRLLSQSEYDSLLKPIVTLLPTIEMAEPEIPESRPITIPCQRRYEDWGGSCAEPLIIRGEDAEDKLNWQDAYDYCDSKGMRLPNVNELTAICESARNGTIDNITLNTEYWAVSGNSSGSWHHNLNMSSSCNQGQESSSTKRKVRCVY